jgi:tRNA(adenine34) deaminase
MTSANAVLSAGISATVTMENRTVRSVFQNLSTKMNKDENFMQLALNEAEVAYDKSEVPVGAVLVIDGHVVASAHNNKETSGDPTAHAELLVIREGAIQTGDWRLNDATLYVTKEPCIMCAGAMINARLGRLVYGCRDIRFGAVNSCYQLLHDPALNHKVRVVAGVLEEKCAGVLKKFFEQRR